jgi:hypothetical protein
MESRQPPRGWGTEDAWIKEEIYEKNYWLGRRRLAVGKDVSETVRLLFDLDPSKWENVLSNEVKVKGGKGKMTGVQGRRFMCTPSADMLQRNAALFLFDMQIS